ncbi:MAG: hypothetical protein U9P42_10820 [Candidatus Fermentibacteria bacterium]|nr:hypothetical protein [Candidatus Fermentibacteria bacterium]
MKYHSVFTTVFILFALASSVQANAEDSADWFPLAEGNSWVYEVETYELVDNDTTFNTGTKLWEITDLLTHEAGFPVYEIRTIRVMRAGSDAEESYADTTFEYLQQNNTELRCYSSPALNVYDVWISFGMMNKEIAMLRESSAPMSIRVEPSVTVPAGSFSDCSVIVYPVGEGSGTNEYYFHQGTGLIKTEYSTASFHMTESLIDFNIQQ